MLDTSARLLRLLALLQSRRFWSGTELAERLEVTERTVRRDIDRLRSLGYPVESSSGVAGGYQLGAGASMPPLLLDDEEAMAVSLGLRTATTGSVAGVEEAALRALTKLEQVLPQRVRQRVANLHAAVNPLYWSGVQVSVDTLTTLANASRSHDCLQFCYEDRQGRASKRTVEPHGLVHTGSLWYLVAWDCERDDWRTFRIDRLASPVVMVRRFSPRTIPGGNAATYLSQSVASRPYPYRARVVFHAPHDRIAKLVPPMAAHLEPIDDDHCLLEAGAHSLTAIAMHLAFMGESFEVQEPQELIQEIGRLAKLFGQAAEGSR